MLTKQAALNELNKGKFIGFTTTTGNIIMKKVNKTDYNIFVYEEGVEEPAHYIGSVTNVLKTMSDKTANNDYQVVDM